MKFTYLDKLIDSITMYKVVVYGLLILIVHGFVLSFLKLIPYNPIHLLSSLLLIIATTLLFHTIFEFLYRAPANIESSIISALILFLIVAPPEESAGVAWIVLTTFAVIASKYVLAYNNRHIFNPVAIGLVVLGLVQYTGGVWWVSSKYFFPAMIIVALFVLRKVKRFFMFFTYLSSSAITVICTALYYGEDVLPFILQHVTSWPLLFLGVFMLTEPLTTPPTKKLQGVYGVIVGVFSSFPFALPPLYSTPELAIVIGNTFAFIVGMRSRATLILKERILIAKDTYEFVFSTNEKVPYHPGQYMEWTLPHEHRDTRGMRRYFTIASNPEDKDIRLGIKYFEGGSSFKKALLSLQRGEGMYATSVSGDFLLPVSRGEDLVFIAGGIGITPFVSMLRSCMANEDKRNITLFYANKTEEEIAYKDVLDAAAKKLNVNVVHILSDIEHLPQGWQGEKGFITQELLGKYLNDLSSKTFYISGPPGMVAAYTTLLKSLSVKKIHTDYFPGFA